MFAWGSVIWSSSIFFIGPSKLPEEHLVDLAEAGLPAPPEIVDLILHFPLDGFNLRVVLIEAGLDHAHLHLSLLHELDGLVEILLRRRDPLVRRFFAHDFLSCFFWMSGTAGHGLQAPPTGTLIPMTSWAM